MFDYDARRYIYLQVLSGKYRKMATKNSRMAFLWGKKRREISLVNRRNLAPKLEA